MASREPVAGSISATRKRTNTRVLDNMRGFIFQISQTHHAAVSYYYVLLII